MNNLRGVVICQKKSKFRLSKFRSVVKPVLTLRL